MVQAYYFCQFSISLCCIVHFGLRCLWVPTNAVESEADSLQLIGKGTDFTSRLLNCLIFLCVLQYALRKVRWVVRK
jgi:hypothetical protein